MNEKRKQTIINKYGSLENYEKLRIQKIRKGILLKCHSEEEQIKKIKQWEWEDYLKANHHPELIGKECTCKKCNNKFIAKKSQQLYCSKCILDLARIRNYGSLENYYRIANKHLEESLIKKYGVDNIMKLDSTKQKMIQTKKNIYGEHFEEISKKIEQTKEERYGDKYYVNFEKRKKTNIEKYGAECNWSNKENHKKCEETARANNSYIKANDVRKKTNLDRYNNEFYTNQEKREETNLKKFGFISPLSNKDVREKCKKTCEEKYGVDNIAKYPPERERRSKYFKEHPTINIPGVKEKIINSCLKNGGFSHRNTYKYNNLIFDSSWELYYYMYLVYNNINFIYKPSGLKYISNNKEHTYFPDFYTDHYIELKGDNLIDENGILQDFNGNKFIEKTAFLKLINVEFIFSKDIKPIIKEMKDVYGSDYIKQFKVVKNGKNSKN